MTTTINRQAALEAAVSAIVANAAEDSRDLDPGDEFTITSPELADLGELTDREFDTLVNMVDAAVHSLRVMVESMHDVKVNFTVF